MSEDLSETVKYISQRENELSRYSDKLRKSVQKIFDLFGDPRECQVCERGNSEEFTQHFPFSTYHTFNDAEYGITEEQKNELLLSGKYFFTDEKGPKQNEKGQIRIFPNKEWHTFTPKIRLSLNVEGPVYDKDEDGETKLASRDGMLVILYVNSLGDEDIYQPYQVSRKELKQIVREKRISEFLKIYQEKLDTATEEYKQVSEIAEKMASVL